LQAFDVLFDPEEQRRFVLYEIYEDQVAFDEHLASSNYLSFADAIENEIEQRSVRRLASCRKWRLAMIFPRDGRPAYAARHAHISWTWFDLGNNSATGGPYRRRALREEADDGRMRTARIQRRTVSRG
jgi:hypothetical protein